MVLGEKRIQVVITSGGRDKVRQGMLFSSNCVYRNNVFASIPTNPFAILYVVHSLASFLRSDMDLHLEV